MYKVKQISLKDTYPVRHKILRKGKPIETCYFDGDNDINTFHLGLFFEFEIIGIVSYMKNTNNEFSESKQHQLRGMAILEEYQGKGLGELLVKSGEVLLKQNKCSLIWLNSRIKAVNFYKRQGYSIKGNYFEIKDIGTHYLMSKKLG